MDDTTSARRLGLALSGGGFRASFYHIGVLARMAELGMLRHVESISTVSGGSIVGAAYYLLLKNLLESKSDREITDQDYVDMVQRLEVHFLEAVQQNLRMRTFANPWKNLKMSKANYSRSDTIGEIYEKYIYEPLLDVGDRRLTMNDLLIKPKAVDGNFHPMDETVGNPVRNCKVPVLVLNATSLNSGHNWVFTATSMGEVPPRNLNFRDIDKKDRYRRVRYDEITTRTPSFRLGNAVAASAGVPGLFPPMAVSGLYRDRRVELVDGGVYDNQGVAGLLDPEPGWLCSDFIVSDASGQSDATDNPDTEALSVLIASSGVMGSRVREEMVNSLEISHDSENVAYFHLTRGLFARDIEFNNGGVSSGAGSKMKKGIVGAEDEFEVTGQAQRNLAHIRTDLDSFTDVEAGCLQADAYQMSESRLLKMKDYLAEQPLSGNWQFSRYLPALKNGDEMALKHLDLGRHQFFKPWLYVFNGATSFGKALGLAAVSIPLILSLVAIFWAIDWALKKYAGINVCKILTDVTEFQAFMGEAALAIYALILSFVLSKLADLLIRGSGKWASKIQKLLKSPMALISGIFIRALLPVVFSIPIIIYLYTIDRYFIRQMGKLD